MSQIVAKSHNGLPGVPGGLLNNFAQWVADIGARTMEWIIGLGSISLFFGRTLRWLVTKRPRRETILWNFYQIGVLSLPVQEMCLRLILR